MQRQNQEANVITVSNSILVCRESKTGFFVGEFDLPFHNHFNQPSSNILENPSWQQSPIARKTFTLLQTYGK
jgi:hypothetical protein